MISHKLKFIFIHIPKTSGSSLTIFLKDYIDNDLIQKDNKMGDNQGISILCEKKTLKIIKRENRIYYKKTKKSIKHENIKYYENLYNEKIKDYFKFTIVRNPYDRMLSYYFYALSNPVFNRNEFIEFIKNDIDLPQQYTYIDNTFHIIHFENLIDELKNIECFKNIVDFNNYPRLNASHNSKINYNDIYDKELKDLVFNKYKKDFELFGYEY